jgi:O-antigen biosynthesis protein
MNLKTSIVILTYNQLDLTKKCFDSIFKHTNMDDIEMIIVDNGSTDGTREYLKGFPFIKTVLNEKNLGFAKGCNQGAEIASGDNVLFLNNDTIVTENWLNPMLSLLYSDEKVGMVGPVSNYVSGTQQVPFDYTDISGIDDFAAKYCEINRGKSKRVLRLVGFCLLAKNDVFKKIGSFDERYQYGSFEDDDLCLKAIQAGYQLQIALDSFVHHHGHATFTGNQDININHLFFVNRQRYVEKWGMDLTYYTHPRLEIVGIVPEEAERILDVGCGAGSTGLELINRNPASKLYGIELNPFVADLARNHYEKVENTDVEILDLEYPEGYFDVILCNDVLEHLRDPWKVVEKLSFYLKPSGSIICSIPNISHAEALLPLLLGKWNYVDAGILDRTHFRFFTPQTVQTLFPVQSFELISQSYVYSPPDTNTQSFFNAVKELARVFSLPMEQLPEYVQIYQMILHVKKKVPEVN